MNSQRPTIVAVIIVDDGRVLMVRRRFAEGSLSWQFPSGEMEPGESAIETAVRESAEEVGLDVSPRSIIGERDHPNTGRHMIYVSCDVDWQRSARLVDVDELDSLQWCTWSELVAYVPVGLFEPVRTHLESALRPVTERVRALLIAPTGELLTVRRDRPGTPPYWVLPGGHVEPTDSDREAALQREIREELGGTPQILGPVAVLEAEADAQYVYLARIDSWSEADRTGPEFDDLSRGSYLIDLVPLTIDSIERINLKPAAIAALLIEHLTHSSDLLTMPVLDPPNGRASFRDGEFQPSVHPGIGRHEVAQLNMSSAASDGARKAQLRLHSAATPPNEVP